ncbi:hypothetical protein [Chromobacterium sp.]|uniref:hypothetical protein n=1 Tax=Chromobacterium sp. TaxID=306190 RepID=UPI0035ADD0DA
MKTVLIYSAADAEAPASPGSQHHWYTLVQDPAAAEADHNPWDGRAAILKKPYELQDDCRVSIRPARCFDPISRQEQHKNLYLIEIANQGGSSAFCSRRLYRWPEALGFIAQFEGLSFPAAARVWRAKKP